jgi:DNA replication regulator DPB11
MTESGQIPGLDGFLVSGPTYGDVHAPEVPIAADDMVLEPISFGIAQGALSRSTSFVPHPSSICTPTCSMASPVVQSLNNNESFTARSTSNVESFKANDSRPLSRRPSQRSANDMPQVAEEVDSRMRVPSSKSPSPMKLLKNISGGGSRLSLSPVKIDHEATKALQESITSLLGKRLTPDGDDLTRGAAGVADGPNGRNGKRARPHRSKVSITFSLRIWRLNPASCCCSLKLDKVRMLT